MATLIKASLLLGILIFLARMAWPAFCSKRRLRTDLSWSAVLIGMFVLGWLLKLGQWTFPLVYWGMYTTPFEDEHFASVRLVAIDEHDREAEINPVACFPSLSHCLEGRLVPLVTRASQDKLTDYGEQVYDDLMCSFLRRHNQLCQTKASQVRVELVARPTDPESSCTTCQVVSETDFSFTPDGHVVAETNWPQNHLISVE